ncbi:MAG: SRPBCC domain-containing protein [Geodermatophilaceae bacterium]|nr:SRPBCC domain-containing protein [Geodermatophilaceae bacterium]MDQ3454970.1 SRPBCC domain-containing protein [Actinomycetota bacterium]
MTVAHDTFTVKRRYPVPRDRVFVAWADPTVKIRWFTGSSDSDYRGEFVVGGTETTAGDAPDGTRINYEGVYRDIVPGERIVVTYEMARGGRRMSVSVLTAEFTDDGDGTQVRLTDQGTYLDDLDSAANRSSGAGTQLDQLGDLLVEPA